MTPRIERTLRGFHLRVYWCLAGMKPKRNTVGQWDFPNLGAKIPAAGLEEVDTYVLRSQNTIAQYIMTRPILEMCLSEERWLGMQVTWKWV